MYSFVASFMNYDAVRNVLYLWVYVDFYPIFHVYGTVWAKLGLRHLKTTRLRIFDFCDIQHREDRISHGDVNKI